MKEVAGAGEDVASALHQTRPGLTWGFRKVFDCLDRMAGELRKDSRAERWRAACAPPGSTR